jgi:hypothetical protein
MKCKNDKNDVRTIPLKVDKADKNDVRTLIVRASNENVEKITKKEYCDGVPVLIENRKKKKKTYAILRSDGFTDDSIKMDDWIRRKLGVNTGEEVNVSPARHTRIAQLKLFWKMVFKHPDLNQRWSNFGIFLAISAFLTDLLFTFYELRFSWICLAIIAVVLFFSLFLIPPIILIPSK